MEHNAYPKLIDEPETLCPIEDLGRISDGSYVPLTRIGEHCPFQNQTGAQILLQIAEIEEIEGTSSISNLAL